MVRVIINADDLGKSHEVNTAIAEALSDKAITSSTILANNSTWEEVHQIVNDNPDASVGVHLNLTEGIALTDSPILRKYQVVDENNCFTKGIREVADFTEELVQVVYEEWDAQIRKVSEVEGIAITHFDGHHHVHSILPLAGIICKLGEKYNIHKLRNRYFYPRGRVYGLMRGVARIPFLSGMLNRSNGNGKLMPILQREAENALWQRQISQTFKTPDYFNAYESEASLLKSGITLPEGTVIELMCHPGHPDFEKEYQMIKDRTINTFQVFSLISYREL